MADPPVPTVGEPARSPLGLPRPRRGLPEGQLPVLAVVAIGGVIGSCARYGAALVWPTADGAFPWTTLTVNAVGCAVIGAFMVLITEVRPAHRLVRPFFGTGVLGGFTTFSTYTVDVRQLAVGGHPRTALAYLALTLLAALAAVWTTSAATRRLVQWRRACA